MSWLLINIVQCMFYFILFWSSTFRCDVSFLLFCSAHWDNLQYFYFSFKITKNGLVHLKPFKFSAELNENDCPESRIESDQGVLTNAEHCECYNWSISSLLRNISIWWSLFFGTGKPILTNNRTIGLREQIRERCRTWSNNEQNH